MSRATSSTVNNTHMDSKHEIDVRPPAGLTAAPHRIHLGVVIQHGLAKKKVTYVAAVSCSNAPGLLGL